MYAFKLLPTLAYPTTRSRPRKLSIGHVAHAQLELAQITANSAENRQWRRKPTVAPKNLNRSHVAHAQAEVKMPYISKRFKKRMVAHV